MKYSENVFRKKCLENLNALSPILNNLSVTTYKYMPHHEFEILMSKNFNEGLRQYWTEILYRAHFASVSSLQRNHQWILGMELSYQNNLFLPFASCFRALIESAADTFDGFDGVPLALAQKSKTINKILTSKYRDKAVFISRELEDKLIHFSHGRKINRTEYAPDSHKTKSAAQYINKLDKSGATKLYECYSELCEYVHPAARSTANFVASIDENTHIFSAGFDREKIESLMLNYENVFEIVLSSAFTPGVVTLKILRKLSEPTCQLEVVDKVSAVNIPLWNKCIKYMK